MILSDARTIFLQCICLQWERFCRGTTQSRPYLCWNTNKKKYRPYSYQTEIDKKIVVSMFSLKTSHLSLMSQRKEKQVF
ncbi:hypothetical protein PR048_020825 [Dryococelus australis]|uniref:Uncharacterized protein n=1 Tax=Dryococelus australis TaxID=614101 RepID=A0ABQ9GWH5_9NEOP|nr:hypothetical protein PR048_020825 [Dryococelus australis]